MAIILRHEYFLCDNIIEYVQRLEDLGAFECTPRLLKKLLTLDMVKKSW